jgi:uncharacterized protein (DUF4415 family)
MTRRQKLGKNEAAVRGQAEGVRSSSKRSNRSGVRPKKAKGLTLNAMKISDFYRPLKKPITLRLDADVLAWFKKDGRRYQTRINSALRKVMEREMKSSG